MTAKSDFVKRGHAASRLIGVLAAGLLVNVVLVLSASAAADGPQYVYLTWQSDTSTTMTVVFHVNGETDDETRVYYDTEPRNGNVDAYRHAVACEVNGIPGAERADLDSDGIAPTQIELRGPEPFEQAHELARARRIHHAELTDLEPGGTHYFVVGNEEIGFSEEKKFRTLPLKDAPKRVINGGDMTGGRPGMEELMEIAAAFDPDFALIGGDFAYDNGNYHRIGSWERLLSAWTERMVTEDGYLIPMVAAIGNHESNQRETDDLQLRQPFFYSFLPQGGSSYFTRTFGDGLVVYVLNSGHLVAPADQVDWLRKQMQEHQDEYEWSMAMYHVPLYPSVRSYSSGRSPHVRHVWLPVFDAFKLDVGLEHHDHAHKRTHRLRNNAVHPEGTLYIGDGAFGKGPRDANNKAQWYMAASVAARHIWLIEFESDGLRFQAVDPAGEVFDEYFLDKSP